MMCMHIRHTPDTLPAAGRASDKEDYRKLVRTHAREPATYCGPARSPYTVPAAWSTLPGMTSHDPTGLRRDPDMTPPARVTVEDAAKLLGITVDAVRKRIERGTLRSVRVDKTRYVLLDGREDANMTSHDPDMTVALLAELKDRIRFLEAELESRKEEARRKDHLLAAALERVPAIEVPSEGSDSPMTAADGSDKGTPTPEPERRPWWLRLFGG